MGFITQLEEIRSDLVQLARPEASRWFSSWCEVFLEAVKRKTGSYRYRSYHWHAFSYGLVPAHQGHRAFEAFDIVRDTPLLLVPESWQASCGVKLANPNSADFSEVADDVYVFPESLEWTMVFTHEPNIGPYFSTPDVCDDSG